MDRDFCGIDTPSDHKCHHRLNPARKVAFVCAVTSRTFLGCPHYGNKRCSWLKWIDEPWGAILSRLIMHLWDQAALYRDRSDVLENRKKEMDQVYLEL